MRKKIIAALAALQISSLSAPLSLQLAAPAEAAPQTKRSSSGQKFHAASSSRNSNSSSSSKSSTQIAPSSTRLYGQVDEMLSACANAGVQISSTKLPARIEKVRMGSPAFYAGLEDGDTILKGNLQNNRLHITFRRGVGVYSVDLATEAAAEDRPALKTSASEKPPLKAETDQNSDNQPLKASTDQDRDSDWKRLNKYDIVMVIDRSGSMGEPSGAGNYSKWEWCNTQLSSFAAQAGQATGQRFTIVTFSGDYNVRRNCATAEIEETFRSIKPAGATDLATPLDFVLSDYCRSPQQNPLLVVVLTDGVPGDPDLVERAIIDTTKRVHSQDRVKIVFFEIGNDPDGAALIKLLDLGLVNEGARFDIVDSASFERLQKVGLKSALIETFKRGGSQPANTTVRQDGDLQSELAAVRKQLQQARSQAEKQPANR